jgi:hypothetical protein
MHERIVLDQAREHDLGRDDLILPVYYVSTPELDDSERRDPDELARILGSRQFADWRGGAWYTCSCSLPDV